MKFWINNWNEVLFYIIHRTALHVAAEEKNAEIVELLLKIENIDINAITVLKSINLIEF